MKMVGKEYEQHGLPANMSSNILIGSRVTGGGGGARLAKPTTEKKNFK
jgi:hypothetical protein